MPKRLFLISLLTFFIAGCADLYTTQPPAPVFGGHAADKPQNTPAPVPEPQHPDETVITEPLKAPAAPESIEFKPDEALPADTALEPEIQTEPQPQQPLTQAPALAPIPRQPEPEPEPQLTPFEPLEISAPLSPAVGALVLAANQNTSNGNLETASATIERAIRIEPRNANLFYKLALIRIKQSKPRLAEDLAKKSALLAANDRTLKKHSWLLVAHARELQHNFKGAKEARAKADGL